MVSFVIVRDLKVLLKTAYSFEAFARRSERRQKKAKIIKKEEFTWQ